MKKFIKNKIDNTSSIYEDPRPRLKREVEEESGSEFHPPLPTESPPNVHVMPLIRSPKKEFVEEMEVVASTSTVEPMEVINIKREPRSNNEVDICKNFLRNDCTRPNCKYRHELDLTKLHNVYIFCRDFQNKGCKHNPCKYVHATVTEKERFFKTGYLPPETLVHQKRNELPAAKKNGQLRVKSQQILAAPPPPSWRKTPPPPVAAPPVNIPPKPNMGLNVNLGSKMPPSSPMRLGLQFNIAKIQSMKKTASESRAKIETVENKKKRMLNYLVNYLNATMPLRSMDNDSNRLAGLLTHCVHSMNLSNVNRLA